MSKVNEYLYYISSKQRESNSNSSSDFNMRIFPNLNLVKSTNYWKVYVLSATIPFSFKQVNIFNNTFYIEFNSNIIPITLPVGNYNIKDLSTQIATGIISACLPYDMINFTINYNLITGFCTFTYISSSLGIPTIKIFGNSTISEMIGINVDTTINLGSSVSGQLPFNVNPILSLYIRSSSLNQNNNLESLFDRSKQTNILAEILLSENPNSFINWTNSENIGVRVNNKTLDSINLYLGSSDDNVLNLQGLNWSCLLLFEEWEPQTILTDVNLNEVQRNSESTVIKPSENRNDEIEALNKKLAELKNKVSK